MKSAQAPSVPAATPIPAAYRVLNTRYGPYVVPVYDTTIVQPVIHYGGGVW